LKVTLQGHERPGHLTQCHILSSLLAQDTQSLSHWQQRGENYRRYSSERTVAVTPTSRFWQQRPWRLMSAVRWHREVWLIITHIDRERDALFNDAVNW